jgi:hypothetical protein
VEDSEGTYPSRLGELGSYFFGWPVTREVVNGLIRDGERVTVIGCGPETFMIGLGNAVANAQKRVLGGSCKEIGMP